MPEPVLYVDFYRFKSGQPQYPKDNRNVSGTAGQAPVPNKLENGTSRLRTGAGKAEQMSTVIDPNAANQNLASAATAPAKQRQSHPLGINARRVVSKRYSLKDAQGEGIEEWPDIVRRVVGHVSVAESQDAADCTIRMKEDVFMKLLHGGNPMTAFMMGRIKVDGDMSLALKLKDLFF